MAPVVDQTRVVEYLIEIKDYMSSCVCTFDLDLSFIVRLGDHLTLRMHCGKECFPGMTTTPVLTNPLEKVIDDRSGTHRFASSRVQAAGEFLIRCWCELDLWTQPL